MYHQWSTDLIIASLMVDETPLIPRKPTDSLVVLIYTWTISHQCLSSNHPQFWMHVYSSILPPIHPIFGLGCGLMYYISHFFTNAAKTLQ